MLWSRSANRARGDCQLRGSRAERLLSRRNSPWSTPAPAHCTSPGPRVAGATLAARSNAPHPRCHFPPGSITPYRGTYLSRFLSGTRPWASVVGPDVPRESLPTHRRSTPRSRLTVPAWVRVSVVGRAAIVTPSARPAKGPRTALANSPIEECWAILAGAQPVTSLTCLTKFVLVPCTSESNDFSFPAWIPVTLV